MVCSSSLAERIGVLYPADDVRRRRRPLGRGDNTGDNCVNLLLHVAPTDDEEKRLNARARRGEVGITGDHTVRSTSATQLSTGNITA